jgi:hypothetical protein
MSPKPHLQEGKSSLFCFRPLELSIRRGGWESWKIYKYVEIKPHIPEQAVVKKETEKEIKN